MIKQNDILEFISAEHHNEMVSIANLKSELGFLQELDEIYQDTLRAFSANENNDVQVMVSTMSLQAHSELYVGMSQFLKSHLSKAFMSLRISIDASFNAYYFIKNPKNTRAFLEEDSPLQKKIFWRIKDHITKNTKGHSLIQRLAKIHEIASNFSAHSSLQSIVYKYKHTVDTEQKKEEVLFNYFDAVELRDFFAYYFVLLKGHFMVFQLFYNEFFKKEFQIISPEREKRIADFETKINLKGKQYPLSRKGKAENKE